MMAFAIYLRHRNEFQPEPPQILDKNINDPNIIFTFVDFIPSVIKRSGTAIPQFQVEYHPFSTMIEVANQWLQNQGQQWQVVNCETIIILFKYDDTNNYELRPNDCCFYIYGSEKNHVLRALRLWVRRKVDPELINSQIISFKDMIPKYKKNNNEFENLDNVIERFNNEIKQNGLDGTILTIESIAYDANTEWEIDTETSLSTLSTKNIYILRIFYEIGKKTYAQIGIEDFQPKLLAPATFFKRPKFETFDRVIERGSIWLKKNHQKRFVNAQSIDVKMKSPTSTNSRLMAFTEHGDYMRVFRITYIEMDSIESSSSSSAAAPKSLNLSVRMFLPHKKSDTIADITQRLTDWINQYQEKLRTRKRKLEITSNLISSNNEEQLQKKISNNSNSFSLSSSSLVLLTAETVEIYAKNFRHDNRSDIEKAANEDTFVANRFGNKNAYLFFSFRVYYDDSDLLPSDSVTNITTITDDDNQSTWTIDSLVDNSNRNSAKPKNTIENDDDK